MPIKPSSPCRYPMCPNLAVSNGYCLSHAKKAQQAIDATRGSSSERGYDSHWQKIRKAVLNQEPLCRECKKQGIITAATEVDHIDGNVEHMDLDNLQPLCHPCHSHKTVAENGGLGRVNEAKVI